TGPKHLTQTLTRAKLEQLCDDLLNRTISPVKNCLKDSGFDASKINEVIMVGGQTRMPKVVEIAKKLFDGKEPHKGVNPDEVVAVGAAIQGGVLSGHVEDIVLLDVTPLSLGIETLGGVSTRLIERNTTIPTRKSEIFSTASDNQPSVDIHVLQGEREMARDNKSIGRFRLEGLPPAPRGVPQIEVTFDIDANGILNVTAKDLGTGKVQKITITASSGLNDKDIEKMVKDAEKFAEQDKSEKEKIETRNKADSMIYHTEKQMKEFGEKLPDNVKKPVQDGIDELKKAKEADDIEKMKNTMKSIEEHLMKFGEEIYKQAGANQAGAAGAGGAGAGSAGEQAGGPSEQAADDSEKKSSKKKGSDEKVVDAEVVDDDK
ncbi:MAG: Hsp70 family protein, partial [Victivallales bacterium]